MLSVIIVNYNVKHFLEQCLFSVMQAIQDIDAEVIVVDNASTDGSKEFFLPDSSLQPGSLGGTALQGSLVGGSKITFIWNEENLGFARANNQALARAKGDYLLFLNPDTIIAEDSLVKCLQFMETHPEAGAIGVHMVDGGGRFLKESKRAYPTLATSFFKLCGLAALFPKSKTFARYHLGHLDPTQTHEVDVLAGAFMMVRKEALDEAASPSKGPPSKGAPLEGGPLEGEGRRERGFDEDFFMYGEDIDLSYRIQKAGFKNYYFAGTTIIHFKGESTKRGSLNYVRMFYQAMSTFVQKHYEQPTAKIYRFAINIAIWARAAITAFAGFIKRNGLPLVDGVNTLISFIAATFLWNRFVKPETVYEKDLLMVVFPAFTLVFILVSYYAGLYDRQQKRGRVVYSTFISVLIVLTLYSLLPERYRFSRGILLLGSLFSFLLLSLNRLLLRKWGLIEEEEEEKLGTVIVGTEKEFDEASSLMQRAEKEQRVLGRIAIEEDGASRLVTLANLKTFMEDVPVREIIFCQGQLSFGNIINQTTQLKDDIRIRIHACGSHSIVGSDSSRSAGTSISTGQPYSIDRPSARRYKRLIDLLISGFLLIGFPINIFLIRNPAKLFRNIWLIVVGRKSWVGYSTSGQGGLPKIREGIIGTNALPVRKQRKLEEGLMMVDQLYAREYSLSRDLNLISKGYKWLGT